jgi:hypothetical protein
MIYFEMETFSLLLARVWYLFLQWLAFETSLLQHDPKMESKYGMAAVFGLLDFACLVLKLYNSIP